MWTPDAPSRARRRATFAVHLFAVGLVLASCAWVLTDELKRALVARAVPPVLDWASLFHHPADAALLPYAGSALAAFGWGLFLYLRLRPAAFRTLRRLRRAASARHLPLLAAIVGVQALLVSSALPRAPRAALAILSVLACVVRPPAFALAVALRLPLARAVGALRAVLFGSGTPVSAFCVVASAVLLFALAVEPVKLATRPVRLLNEYMYLPQRALVVSTPGGDLARTAYWRDWRDPGRPSRRCSFAFEDPLEYGLQSMSRGQLNHIGHVLNPLNEVETGKPLERTYFQYGLGATFLFKWVMDLSGGLSLQAYYHSLLFFVAYWLVFAGAAVVLFRDARYVLAALGLVGVAHYMLGYHALLLAPGINPLLHFLDLPVLLACLWSFRSGRWGPLALGALGAAAAVAVNGLYGGMVAAAFCVASGMRVLETAPAGRVARRLLALAALVAVPLAALALALPRTGGGSVTSQFLGGFFSWRPSPWLVFLTLAYLAGSYVFLLRVRGLRDPAKYAVVYLFVYAQGFFVYFYWSGLENHFWPVLPYVGLHLLLMLRTLAGTPGHARWEQPVLAAVILGVVVVGKVGVDGFVRERNTVGKVFARWETHVWPFPRARVISTADPAPIAASLAQVERYSGPAERGICILSVFDNLIPFLAGRHSIFPHFDLQWALLTEEERRRAVEVVAGARPRYLFVGREVEGDVADPWDACGNGMDPERESARGRVDELRRVLDAVSADYERVETGPLLSVYRRRDRSR